MPKVPAKVGRPSSYTATLAATICEQMAAGRSLVSILDAEGMPHYSTVMRWIEAHPEFRDNYTRATEQRADRMAEEMLDIADDSTGDMTETEDGTVVNHEHVQRAKLRVDTRKWLLAKMMPKKYGERVQTEHTGAGGAPLEMTVRFVEG